VTAGTLGTLLIRATSALPNFFKFFQIKHISEDWKLAKEIPIEVEIGKAFKFHSIFVCPVSKEVNMNGEPPKLLKCGHIISG